MDDDGGNQGPDGAGKASHVSIHEYISLEDENKRLKETVEFLTIKSERYKHKLALAKEVYEKVQRAYSELKERLNAIEKQKSDLISVGKETTSEKTRQGLREGPEETPERRRSFEKDGASPSEYTPTQLPYSAMEQVGLYPGSTAAVLANETEAAERGHWQLAFQGHHQKENECPDVEESPESMTRDDGKASEAKTKLQECLHGGKRSPQWEEVDKYGKQHRAYVVDDDDDWNAVAFEENRRDHHGKDNVGYKYEEVVRKMDDRKMLQAGTCQECRRFYDTVRKYGKDAEILGMAKRLCGHDIHTETSRHRRMFKRPSTPPGYWNITMD